MFQKKLKQMGAWLLSLSMVLGSAQLPAMETKAAEGNLALSATATSSGVEEGTSLTADRAIDGEINREAANLDQSRWASDTAVGAKWLKLAWDTEQTMKSFAIEWERKNATDYSISVSNDGEAWTSVWSSKEIPADYHQVVTLDKEVSAKYVRLDINAYNAKCAGYGKEDDPEEDWTNWNTVSVYEFEVYADEAAGPVDPVDPVDPVEPEDPVVFVEVPQSEMTAAACSEAPTAGGEGPAAFAIDGDEATYWHSDWSSDVTVSEENPHWLQVTLENAKVISKLTYLPRQDLANGRIYTYSIEVTKPDGTTQLVVEKGEWEDTADMKTATFDPIEAKSVKLLIYDSKSDSVGVHATVAELKLYEQKALEPKYTIYPTPQSVIYAEDEATLTLPEEVNVVFEDGIDQPTKDRLAAVLSVKDIKVKEVNEAENDKVNILIGTFGSKGAAAEYAAANLEYPEDLFDNRDAYVLAIEGNQITVVGKDTDAAFYALASLKMILEQSEGTTVYQLQMNDYSIGQYRGFIEGYYGIPWSVEDRISLMNFGGDFKMNTYIFAPKDDPYHNTDWRKPYPDDKLKDIERMVKAGTASKCRFVWAIHPFMHDAITTANYDQSVEDIKAKFQQLYDVGVRQFVISADDASSSVQIHANLCRDMSEWVKEHEGTYNLVFVPQVYCSGAVNWSYWGGSTVEEYFSYFKDLTDLDIMWTGEYVCHPVTQYTLNNFKSKSGKEAFMWLNWPVNDVNHARLVMGPAENCILNTGGVTGFKGIVTNPLEQAEASKTSLFAIADYAWNTKAFDCETSWADCFQYIDAGASESLHEICKHLTNPSPGGITQMSESKEIKPFVTAFQADYEAGNDLTESGTALIEQFEKIIAATDDFQANGTNENLKDEMKPWVDSLRKVSEAGVNFIKTAMELQKNDAVEATKAYIKATNAYDASKKCAAPQLNNGTINAESGAMVLIPFASSMNNSLKSKMETLLKHEFGGGGSGNTPGDATKVSVIYSGLGGFYSGSVDEIIDGDDSTYAWFNQPQTADAYVGLDLGVLRRINTVKIRQGNSDTHGDIFENTIVEYSEDGNNYTQIETIEGTNNIDRDYTDKGIVARYIRIRTATASDKWYAIREFAVTTSDVTEDAYTNVEALKALQVQVEQNSVTMLIAEGGTDVTLKADEYVGIELPKIREVTSVTADYTANANLVLEGSLDGTEWAEIKTGEQKTDMSRIRIHNKGTADVSFKLTALSLTNSDRDARFAVEGEYEEGQEPAYVIDNSLLTSFRAKDGAGSLTWRISDAKQAGPLYILTYPGTVKDAKVSIQTSDNTWVDKGSLTDGLTIVKDLEWYDAVKTVKVEWTETAPEIVEMYTTEPRTMGITLDKESATIKLEGTLKLNADVFVGQDEDSKVIWSSDNTEVATVDEDGLVTGVAAGKATITASVAGGKYTATCTIVVSTRNDLTEIEIKAVEAGSVEEENASSTEGPANLAIDKNSGSIWHSDWNGDDLENLWISADLGDVYDVSQFKYQPRSNAGNGTITGYNIYVSQDGEEWTLAATGTWEADASLKTAEIIEPVPARYVKLAAKETISDQGANMFASAAEISVFGYEKDPSAVDKRYVIDAALSDTLEESRYTEESYKPYKEAKDKATEVMNNITATQEEVDAAAKAYKEAVAGLVVKVTDIVLKPTEVTLKIGTTAQLEATVKPADATDQKVTFTSDKPNVASVSAEGLVTAKEEGTAVITAASANGVNATCTVTVVTKFVVTGVKVKNAPKRALEIGDQVTVTAVVEPDNADNKNVTWTSDKPEVATVDNGVVTAVGAGEAKITVTTEDGNFTAEFTVKVNPLPVVSVTGLEVSGAPAKALEIGDKVTVKATVLPENADNKKVIWTSSKPAVATVADGVITAVAAGETVITAATEDGNFTKTFTVKVNAKAVTPTPVNPGKTIEAGKTYEAASGRYAVVDVAKKTAVLQKANTKNKKKAAIAVPATVTLNGVKCKVVEVGATAFKGFTKLKKVVLTQNVKTIGKNAFAGCKNLKQVVIKGTALKNIKAGAFKKTNKKITVSFKSKKVSAKKRAALLKKMKKAGMSKSAKLK